MRFFLTIEDNREHLRLLLRHAADSPGAPIERTLSKNRAYIDEQQGRVRFDAFLALHRRELTLEGARYVLQLEEDPIEVLRMGIPFDTCLSLTDGCNAASTVLNALEVNKRVLYVRDGDGAIVGRKLLAISEDVRLLGYNLYCAVPSIRSALEIAVDSYCRAFADACGLALADSGEPKKLHEGFWYDDGAVAWPARAPGSDVALYCAHLGRPVPEVAPTRLCDEARRFAARTSGDVARMLRALPSWLEGPGDALLGDTVVEQLGIEESVRTAKRHDDLYPCHRARARQDHARPARHRGATARRRHHLRSQRRGFERVRALRRRSGRDRVDGVAGARRSASAAGTRSRPRRFELHRHFRRAQPRVFFAEAARLERVFAHIVADDAKCAACREESVAQAARSH